MEWVEIIEPRTKDHMYANLTTGECVWDPPKGVNIKRADSSQWWELFDTNTQRFYYYNVSSLSTVWHRPCNCDIIPLAKLQTLKQNTDPSNQRSVSSGAASDERANRSTGSSRSSQQTTQPQQHLHHEFGGQSHLRQHSGSSGGDTGTAGRRLVAIDNGSPVAEMRGGDLMMSPQARHSYRVSSLTPKVNPVARTESQRYCRHAQGSTAARNHKSHLDSGKSSDSSLSSSHGYRRLQEGGGGSLRLGSSAHGKAGDSNYRLLQESSSSHNIPHVALPINAPHEPHGKVAAVGFSTKLPYSVSNSSDLCCAAAGDTGTPQQPRKKMPAEHFAQLSAAAAAAAASNHAVAGGVMRHHEDSGVGSSGSVATKLQSFDYGGSAKDGAVLSLTRSGSFLSSPRAQQYHHPASPNASSAITSTSASGTAANRKPSDGGAGSDDSMHEKYFKSVESTPITKRRNLTAANAAVAPANTNSLTASTPRSKHSHSSDSSPQSPVSPLQQQQQQNSLKASRPTLLVSSEGTKNAGHKLDADLVNLQLANKPENYLDKMKLAKISPSASSPSGSATISMQQINNLLKSGNRAKGYHQTPSVASPSAGRSQPRDEPYLSKPNLERHSKEMEQVLHSAKKASAAHKNRSVASSKGNQHLATGVTDLEYGDNGNISPLYSNWDQEMQEHLLPLQHYIMEQAKLSNCFRQGGGDTNDSDSLHSDSQSEHSFSGHEPDNEDSDHSDGREGDYLTHHHYGPMGDYDGEPDDEDEEGVSYYNLNAAKHKDFSELVKDRLDNSDGSKPFKAVQSNPFFHTPSSGSAVAKASPVKHFVPPSQSATIQSHSKLSAASMPPNHFQVGPPHHQTQRQQYHQQLQLQQMQQQTNQKPSCKPPSTVDAAHPFGGHTRNTRMPDIGSIAPPPPPPQSSAHALHHQLAIMKECDIEKFAQDNLNLRAKGIFRKKSSVRDMLSWTADAISRPMLALSRDKAGKKMAIEMFRLVQIYMGDRKARAGMSLNSVIRDIATMAVAHPPLRDELYVQLCRQTTENPIRESLIHGWELLAVCLSFIPPSFTFQPALLNYMNRHRDPTFATSFPEASKWPIHVQVSHFATIACRRLDRIGSTGKKQAKKPNEDEINQARDQIFHISMFGNTLDEVMELQKDRHPGLRLPWVQVTLSEQVLLLNGKQTEGIFRVSADVDEVNMLKSRLDRWDVPEHKSTMDAHAPASLLKLWYRELYDPLIPDDLYEDCVATDNPAEVAAVISKLKPLNKSVLMYLVHFLQQFAQADIVANTKMDSSNLAMVFAPNCLRCTSQDPKVILENARKEMAFMRTLITNMDTSSVAGII